MKLSPADHRALVRLGASARLRQLEQEAATILRVYPDLRSNNRANHEAADPKPRRHWTISPAAKKAISVRMKAYWAERRKHPVES